MFASLEIFFPDDQNMKGKIEYAVMCRKWRLLIPSLTPKDFYDLLASLLLRRNRDLHLFCCSRSRTYQDAFNWSSFSLRCEYESVQFRLVEERHTSKPDLLNRRPFEDTLDANGMILLLTGETEMR